MTIRFQFTIPNNKKNIRGDFCAMYRSKVLSIIDGIQTERVSLFLYKNHSEQTYTTKYGVQKTLC
jgi:hypothetical protein